MTAPPFPEPKTTAVPRDIHAEALGAAVSAIAKHITGNSDGHHALVVLGLTAEQATAVTG
jgi:hypothetical protein